MPSPWADRERGAVTAELSVGLVGVVLALALVLSVAVAGTAQVAVGAAAAAGARSAARGDSPEAVQAAARAVVGAPDDARVTVRVLVEGDLVRVTVQRHVPLPLAGPGGLAVRASAAALLERGGGVGAR